MKTQEKTSRENSPISVASHTYPAGRLFSPWSRCPPCCQRLRWTNRLHCGTRRMTSQRTVFPTRSTEHQCTHRENLAHMQTMLFLSSPLPLYTAILSVSQCGFLKKSTKLETRYTQHIGLKKLANHFQTAVSWLNPGGS